MLGPKCWSPTLLALPVSLPGARCTCWPCLQGPGGTSRCRRMDQGSRHECRSENRAGSVSGQPGESCSEYISWHSSLIFNRSWATSELAEGGGSGRVGVRDDTVAGATSNILSAMSAKENT